MKNLLYFLLTLLAITIVMATQSCGSRSGERIKAKAPVQVIDTTFDELPVCTYPNTITVNDMKSFQDAKMAEIINDRTAILKLPYEDYSSVYTWDAGYAMWYYLSAKQDD